MFVCSVCAVGFHSSSQTVELDVSCIQYVVFSSGSECYIFAVAVLLCLHGEDPNYNGEHRVLYN
jgi:hypothetical protein